VHDIVVRPGQRVPELLPFFEILIYPQFGILISLDKAGIGVVLITISDSFV